MCALNRSQLFSEKMQLSFRLQSLRIQEKEGFVVRVIKSLSLETKRVDYPMIMHNNENNDDIGCNHMIVP